MNKEEANKANEAAEQAIGRYSKWAMAGGLIPLPALDIVAVTGVQLKMIQCLADIYKSNGCDVSFSKEVAKNIIGALIGGILPGSMARGMAGSLVKAIPLVGQCFGLVTVSAFSGASTYAVGKVFNQHFASGGTMLDLDPKKMRKFFEDEFNLAKNKNGSQSGKITSPRQPSRLVTSPSGC